MWSVVGIGVLAAWCVSVRPPPYRPQVRALVAALGPRRAFEPRLSGGFHYGPLDTTARSATDRLENSSELLVAAAALQRSDARPTHEGRQAVAAADLLLGRVDRAVERLESLARDAQGDASVQNDLAAAYLVRAASQSRPQDLPRALEAATLAVEGDPGAPESLYNHALALSSLNLHAGARAAWERYLGLVPSETGWDEAARQHLQALAQRSVTDVDRHRERLQAALDARDEKETVALVRESVEASRLDFEARLGDLSGEPRAVASLASLGRAFATVTGDSTIATVAEQAGGGGADTVALHR
ncbi:MAG: hypothetical protein ABW221_15190, partial [Vicinamibacteria bacterium]